MCELGHTWACLHMRMRSPRKPRIRGSSPVQRFARGSKIRYETSSEPVQRSETSSEPVQRSPRGSTMRYETSSEPVQHFDPESETSSLSRLETSSESWEPPQELR